MGIFSLSMRLDLRNPLVDSFLLLLSFVVRERFTVMSDVLLNLRLFDVEDLVLVGMSAFVVAFGIELVRYLGFFVRVVLP